MKIILPTKGLSGHPGAVQTADIPVIFPKLNDFRVAELLQHLEAINVVSRRVEVTIEP